MFVGIWGLDRIFLGEIFGGVYNVTMLENRGVGEREEREKVKFFYIFIFLDLVELSFFL